LHNTTRIIVTSTARPNKPLELTPLRVERDRGDFDGWKSLEGFPDL
jgi:hypothetical protein